MKKSKVEQAQQQQPLSSPLCCVTRQKAQQRTSALGRACCDGGVSRRDPVLDSPGVIPM